MNAPTNFDNVFTKADILESGILDIWIAFNMAAEFRKQIVDAYFMTK